MNKKKLGIIVGATVGVLALGGLGLYFGTQMISGEDSEQRVYVEQISSIMSVNAGMTNRYNGVVESQNTHEITVDSSRKIETIHVEVGQEIQPGQLLVTYDISEHEIQIQQINIEIESILNKNILLPNVDITFQNEIAKKYEVKLSAYNSLFHNQDATGFGKVWPLTKVGAVLNSVTGIPVIADLVGRVEIANSVLNYLFDAGTYYQLSYIYILSTIVGVYILWTFNDG